MDKLKTIVKVLDEKLAEDIVVYWYVIDSPILWLFCNCKCKQRKITSCIKKIILKMLVIKKDTM